MSKEQEKSDACDWLQNLEGDAWADACEEIAASVRKQAEGAQGELWAIHAQGPDDLYAAFNREDAEKHAAELNALPMPEGISVGAVVIPSPWTPAEHWQYLAEQEREHKDAIEGQRRNLAATLLSQNHELMEARAALAPELEQPGVVDFNPYRRHAEKIRQRVEEAASVYEAGGSALGHMEDIAESALIVRNGLDELSVQHDRIVGSLRYKAELYDEVWELVTGKGYMNVTTAISKLEAERDTAQARLAELEKQKPFYYFADCDDPDYSRLYNTEGDALSQISDHGGDVVKLYAAPVAQAGQVPQAWLDVQAERRRQVAAEGWTPEHDNEHDHGQMARAAACYALAGSSAADDKTAALLVSLAWPWDQQWWKPTTARRDLIKACALALAEIERLDRAAAPQPAEGEA
uniref:hypothetical protein n=1 Tax=Pseudomonas sp. RW407 TaxID=2202894 RepID=UPI002115C599|nr:hypothetical protein [Pseudomonas sp. RW407]